MVWFLHCMASYVSRDIYMHINTNDFPKVASQNFVNTIYIYIYISRVIYDLVQCKNHLK